MVALVNVVFFGREYWFRLETKDSLRDVIS